MRVCVVKHSPGAATLLVNASHVLITGLRDEQLFSKELATTLFFIIMLHGLLLYLQMEKKDILFWV